MKSCRPSSARALAPGLVLLFASELSGGAAALTATNWPPLPPALPEAGFSIFRVLGALALVLALFLAGVWGFKNWQRLALARSGRRTSLQVLEVKPLGARQALYVVAYEQQRLLLASSPAGITLVSHLPSEVDAAETRTPEAAGAPFAQTLQQMIQRKP